MKALSKYTRSISDTRCLLAAAKSALRLLGALIAYVLTVSVAPAATVSAEDYAYLANEASKSGHVPILVHFRSTTFDELQRNPAAVTADAADRLRRLQQELGSNALRNGVSANGAGQAELYVNRLGIETLRSTARAISFTRGRGWIARSAFLSLDGAHASIETQLSKFGYVDIEAVLNVDGLTVEFLRDGSQIRRANDEAVRSSRERWRSFVGSLLVDEVMPPPMTGRVAQAVDQQLDGLVVGARFTREGLLRLVSGDLVRAVRPSGFVDQRERWVDKDLLAMSKPSYDVTITLRSDLAGGSLSSPSRLALYDSNRTAMQSIIAGVGGVEAVLYDFAAAGAVAVRINRTQLENLLRSDDRRILAIRSNAAVAAPQLSVANQTMNTQWFRSRGYKGAGQAIAILDTGIEASHPFLANRVTFQACFGTTDTDFDSLCPGATEATEWDSPPNTAGAGLPALGSPHGTHVAGIAAGNNGSGTFVGMAPDASIYSINVFSKVKGANYVLAKRFDILRALQLGDRELKPLPGPNKQPVTINMSLGDGAHSTPAACSADERAGAPNADFDTAIHNLRIAGVVIVAATGNDGSRDGIAWPSCLAGIIKVSSTQNDGVGITRAGTANVVNPANYPNEVFWLAPGGSPFSAYNVNSSVLAGQYSSLGGTSMASPMIAGIYAVAKGVMPAWTEAQITDYLVSNASTTVPITVTTGPLQAEIVVNWRRILFPP